LRKDWCLVDWELFFAFVIAASPLPILGWIFYLAFTHKEVTAQDQVSQRAIRFLPRIAR
jgi:hypothetical protein